MPQAQVRFPSFEAYPSYSDEMDMEGLHELINGGLVELPPESEENNWLALNLRDLLICVIQRRLVRVHACEVQVPTLQVLVLTLDGQDYREVGLFKGNEAITSVEFAELQLGVEQVFETGI